MTVIGSRALKEANEFKMRPLGWVLLRSDWGVLIRRGNLDIHRKAYVRTVRRQHPASQGEGAPEKPNPPTP